MKVVDLYCKILNDFEHEGNTTIIKAVKNSYRLVVSGFIDRFIDTEYKSITISLAEYIKELNRYGFTVEDAEAGLVLFILIKLLWGRTEEIILDFENVTDVLEPHKTLYALINESLERLSYEYGKFLKEHVKIINVPNPSTSSFIDENYNMIIENAILAYKSNILAYEED